MRRVITGPSLALENRLAEEVGAAREADPLTPICVLVGGTLLRPYLQRRLARRSGGIANVHFLTPADFSLILGERAMWAAGRMPLPPLADRILLRQLAADEGGYFEPVRETPGSSDALYRLVRELRGAGYDAAALRDAIAGSCEVADEGHSAQRPFRSVPGQAGRLLRPRRLPTRGGPRAGPLDARIRLRPLGRLGGAALRPRRDSAAATPAHRVPAHHRHLRRRPARRMRDWLSSLGAEAVELEPPAPATALDRVRRQLFSTPTEAVEPDATLQLVSAPDPTREVREVARACMRWAEEGIRFHEMAIAYRNPEPYRSTIESVFSEAGIPVYLHEGTPLSERPLGRRALATHRPARGRPRATQRHRLPGRPPTSRSRPTSATTSHRSPAGIGSRGEAGIVRGPRAVGAAASAPTRASCATAIANGSGLTSLEPRASSPSSMTSPSCSRSNPTSPRGPSTSTTCGGYSTLHPRRASRSSTRSRACRASTPWARSYPRSGSATRCAGRSKTFAATRCSTGARVHSDCVASPSSTRTRSDTSVFARSRSSVLSSARSRRRRAPTRCCSTQSAVKLNERGPAPIPLRVMGPDPEPLQFALAADAGT